MAELKSLYFKSSIDTTAQRHFSTAVDVHRGLVCSQMSWEIISSHVQHHKLLLVIKLIRCSSTKFRTGAYLIVITISTSTGNRWGSHISLRQSVICRNKQIVCATYLFTTNISHQPDISHFKQIPTLVSFNANTVWPWHLQPLTSCYSDTFNFHGNVFGPWNIFRQHIANQEPRTTPTITKSN